MYKPLKFKGDESKFMFTADNHFSQKCLGWDSPLYKSRGYNSLEEHDAGLIKKWNDVCDEETDVFALGDFQFNDGTGEKFWKHINQLRFETLFLFRGNHTSGTMQAYFKCLKEQFPALDSSFNQEIYPLYHLLDGHRYLVFMPEYAEIFINDTILILSHYPILSHNMQNKNSLMLSGHCHNNLPLTNKDTGKGLRLDVGVDGWERPISLAEIKQHLKGRELDIRDHHTSGR